MFVSLSNDAGRRNGQRGVPNKLMKKNNHAVKIPPRIIPDMTQAIDMYRSNGGSLSEPTIFGIDPLHQDPIKENIRKDAVINAFSFSNIFGEVTNGNGTTFKRALDFFIDVTYRLNNSI